MKWLLGVLMIGCAAVSSQYVKPSATPQERKQDIAACQLQVDELARGNAAQLTANGRHWMALCLESKGWIKKDTTEGQ